MTEKVLISLVKRTSNTSFEDLMKAGENVGKRMFQKLCEDMVNVQPMSGNVGEIFNHGNVLTREELIEKGYKPVSSLGLLWIKKGKNESVS